MSDFHEVISGDKPVLVDFYAEWCGPCKIMSPILEDLKKMTGNKVRILKVDIDKNPNTATYYEVKSVPSLLLFKNGDVMWRRSGVIPGNELKKIVERFL